MERSLTELEPVTEQITEFVDRHPLSIALDCGDRKMSYGELANRAHRFAGHLTQLGVVPGDTVAICLERSFDWIVAALGIMRAGAVYVPLDSAWPDSRLRFAVNDSGAMVLVARSALLERLDVKARGLDPCRDAREIAASPIVVQIPIKPESLAYMIYTSGSTGVPKGVEITHANLAHLVRWHQDAFGVTRQDRASHLAGLGFDAAVWEIWPSLCAGATVCVPDDAVRSSAELIQQWMIRERVTISFVPTVHAAPMMEMEWPGATTLRLMLTGGDTLRHGPSRQLPFDVVNNYGPTECTVVATSSVLKPGLSGVPPIGRPIAGTSVYLLTEDGQQVSDGRVGEIYIGGVGVGRGYRNLPDSTERSFLPDPFADTAWARMYRTGDRGLRRPDGEIEFRGRADRQTKIRGQRVELDEIGVILSEHPGVEFATVITNTSEGGENRLVAYILPKKSADEPTSRELQKNLQSRLPAYMVPAIFVRLRALPLSPNGKLDLTILEPPTAANLLDRSNTTSPATPIEEKLLVIVRELLGNNTVSAKDNFFLAGGHSLLGMQLVMRLRNSFGVSLTMQQLFEAPTVERLAPLIESTHEEDRLATLTETKRREERLALIWGHVLGVLGRKHVGLDDNFFDLGGTAELLAVLERRIASEFGKYATIAELFYNPTVRQQARLNQVKVKEEPTPPPGVFVLHPKGTRNSIFWIHNLSLDLARELGADQPFIFVTLAARDIALLGETPSLQTIASCLLQKILATRPEGPYIIGGICVGSVLAYEIANQLRSAGHDVSLLLMLDAPSQPYLSSCNSLTAKLKHPIYLFHRVARIGLRKNLENVCMNLMKRFPRVIKARFHWTERRVAHNMAQAAAFVYYPERYEGDVLLLLAAEHAPHLDFLPGWRSAISGGLDFLYIDGYHREFITPENVESIASAISSRLRSVHGQASLSRSA
jgi:amino acid adenylation domain-containing protein